MISKVWKKGNFIYAAILLGAVVLAQVLLLLFDLPHNIFLVHATITVLIFIFAVWHALIKKGCHIYIKIKEVKK